MKFINKIVVLSTCFFMMATSFVFAQEVIQDTVKAKKTVVQSNKRQKNRWCYRNSWRL